MKSRAKGLTICWVSFLCIPFKACRLNVVSVSSSGVEKCVIGERLPGSLQFYWKTKASQIQCSQSTLRLLHPLKPFPNHLIDLPWLLPQGQWVASTSFLVKLGIKRSIPSDKLGGNAASLVASMTKTGISIVCFSIL